MSRVIRIDDSIADEINRLSQIMQISTVQASQLVFFGNYKKWGRQRKPIFNKQMEEARMIYGRKRIAKKLINVL